MSVPKWVEKYIGIPYVENGRGFDGCDCYGLIWLVSRSEFGIYLPTLDTHQDPETLEKMFQMERLAHWSPTEDLKPGVCVDIRVGRRSHCGILVSDLWMLHMGFCANARCSDLARNKWKRLIRGFYRYNQE